MLQTHRSSWRPVLSSVLLGLLTGSLCAGTIRDDRLDSQYTGLAAQPQYAAVGEFAWNQSGGSYIASGTLINSRWVLTAAHVVADITPANIDTMTFSLAGRTYHVSQAIPHSLWTGSTNAGNDIGLVELSAAVSGVTPAYLYSRSDESRQITTVVGFGQTGNGLTGVTADAGTKRAGTNVIGLGSALNNIPWTGGGNDNMLVFDFDLPGATGDPTVNLAVPTDLEYCAAPGDSGGGWFVQNNGLTHLAGVTSFLVHHPGNFNDAMYGDLAGSTRVSSYLAWIKQYTTYNLSVPGDANVNGRVNVDDLGILASNYDGTGKTWQTGDFTGDGLVNVDDLGLLASHYDWPSGGNAGSLPEPGTLSLLALFAPGLLRPGRRRLW